MKSWHERSNLSNLESPGRSTLYSGSPFPVSFTLCTQNLHGRSETWKLDTGTRKEHTKVRKEVNRGHA